MKYFLSGKITLQHCNDVVLRPLFPMGRGLSIFGRIEVYSALVEEYGLLPPVRDKGGSIGKGIVPSTYFKLQGKLAVVRINPPSFCLYFPECSQGSKLRRHHVKILTLLLFKLLRLIID